MFRDRYLSLVSGLIVAAFCAFGLLSPAAEAAVVLHTRTPEDTTVFNFCTNNIDTVTAVLQTIATETFSGDGSLHVTIHVDNHDVKLSDPVLGDCEGQATLDTAFDVPPGTTTRETATYSLRNECVGPGGIQDATFALPFTVSPSGAVTVGSLTLTGVECR